MRGRSTGKLALVLAALTSCKRGPLSTVAPVANESTSSKPRPVLAATLVPVVFGAKSYQLMPMSGAMFLTAGSGHVARLEGATLLPLELPSDSPLQQLEIQKLFGRWPDNAWA